MVVARFAAGVAIGWLASAGSVLAADHWSRIDPLPRAHSHNDYEQARPLRDALENGFCSVEADIHLKDGELLVAHDSVQATPGRTLERLYLDPLRDLARTNEGRVFPKGPPVILLIDIKTEAAPTYRKLDETLARYRGMLTEFQPDGIKTNAVTVILSGNRPREILLAQENRLAAFDGRAADLPLKLATSFAPLISDSWASLFRWKGDGEFSAAERARLRDLVQQAHSQGKKLRLWAAPDRESAWRELLDAGVDLINTDHLAELAKFLRTTSAN